MRSEARWWVVGALVLCGLGAFVAARIQVTTDVMQFLPGGEGDPSVTLACRLASSELTRTMVLLVGADGTIEAAAASREMEAAMRAEPRLADELDFLDAGPPAGIEDALWQLYHPRRFAFLAADPAEAAARTTPDALREAAARLKRRLALPISTLVSRVAPGDPLLILPELFERLAGSRAEGLMLVDGRLLTDDGKTAVLFVGTRSSPFDAQAQRPFLEGVKAAFDATNARHGGTLTYAQSGANRFSIRAEDAIRADIQRVSTLSLVGTGLLFFWLFRSLRLLAETLLVVGAGYLVGTAACLAMFGHVHGLTLAFGSGLIGVSMDYTIHFYCHQALAPHAGGARRTLAGIWPGLVLGAVTTIAGFVVLIASSFPGLREIAVFGAFGITAALIATRAFFPALMPSAPLKARGCRRLAASIEAAVSSLSRRRAAPVVAVAAVVLLCVVGLPRVRWNDDMTNMNRLDPALVAEDTAVHDHVVRYEQRRFVVAQGRDEESALAVNDRVVQALAAARDAGELGGFRGVASLLPSAASQRAVDGTLRQDPLLWPHMQAALAAEGFVPDSFAPFRDALAEPAPAPLQWSDLAASPLAPLVRSFRVSLGDGVGFVTFLHDLRDRAALESRLAGIAGAQLVDIGASLTQAYAAYRGRMAWLVLIGILSVVVLVWLRHRRIRPTLAACVPAFLAVAATVAVLALFHVELNLLSLVALLMIVSMGGDFGVFLAERHENRDELQATLLAIAVSGVTTIFSFGLLALSDYPALFAIGVTSGLGTAFCLILTPTVRVLFAEPETATKEVPS